MTKMTSYEISKKLAEAGFNIPSDFLINQNGRILHNATKQFIGKIPSFSKPSKEGCEYLGNNYASYDLETILDALPEELINKMALYKELKPYERPKNRGRLEIHHKTGCGIGKKASDLLTIGLCSAHHTKGGRGVALHDGIELFEEQFGTQQDLILAIHEKLGIEIYKNYLQNNF
jgi:hypothetical protein